MPVHGQCALCGLFADLCRSHLRLPKFVYKRLRAEAEQNPNPMMVSTRGMVQTSAQETQHLLCRDCENRFSKLGERWVAANCLQDSNVTFPLVQQFIDARIPRHDIMPGASAFYAVGVSGVNVGALLYFAASMVWRGQYIPDSYSLGPYDSQFSLYLLQRAPFPPDASLHVFLRYRSGITMTSHPVRRHREDHVVSYDFAIPGLKFDLYVGRHRPDWLKQASVNENGYVPLIELDMLDELMKEQIERVVQHATLNKLQYRIS